MLVSEEYRELRNGKRFNIYIERAEKGSIVTGNSSENVEREVYKIQTMTQEVVNEQIKRFIAPLTRQVEKLTRLVQGMVTTPHPSHYPRTDCGTTSGIATY